jgi:hypothetical protein
MKWIQVYIMWAGILMIFVLVHERTKGHCRYFWEYTLVAVLVTAGLILTVEAIKRNKMKGPEEK